MKFYPMWPVLVVGLACLGAALISFRAKRLARRDLWRRLGLAVLVLLLGVRPMLGGQTAKAQAAELDIVLLVDRSTSMAAEDYDGKKQRIEGTKADVRAITEQFAGARFSLVSFASEGRVELPFTTDTNAVASAADTLGYVPSFRGKGSSIDAGLAVAKAQLENAQKADSARGRVLIYLGDGEQTSENEPGSFADIKPLLTGGMVLGYGTEAGGRMKSDPDYDWYVVYQGRDALSKIDESNLRRIAEQIGGRYEHRTKPGDLVIDVDVPEGKAEDRPGRQTGADIAWPLGLMAAGLVLWELWESVGALALARKELS